MENRNFSLDFLDNSDIVLDEFEKSCKAALEKIGSSAATYAAALAPVREDGTGGTLRQSIKYKVVGYEVYIGSATWYAQYVEYGTGRFADNGQGRQGWWVFVNDGKPQQKSENKKTYTYEEALKIFFALRNKKDKNYDEDDVWMTQGQQPVHFLLKAVTEHDSEYLNVLQNSFKF